MRVQNHSVPRSADNTIRKSKLMTQFKDSLT
jgi:hypothetical protein